MKNYLFCIILILLGCGTQTYACNSEIYEDIYICQGSDEIIEKSLNLYRLQLDYLNKLEYSVLSDTIYLLEMLGIQGDLRITIWKKDKLLSYTNEQGYFVSKDKSLFTKYMMKLVSEWNISEIRKEEEEISSNMIPSELIYATRIVFNKGEYQIDCIYFKEFFNLKRDDFYD